MSLSIHLTACRHTIEVNYGCRVASAVACTAHVHLAISEASGVAAGGMDIVVDVDASQLNQWVKLEVQERTALAYQEVRLHIARSDAWCLAG